MMNQIKAGDVVRMKSGGAPMTVEFMVPSVAGSWAAQVIWMTSQAEKMQTLISVEALEKLAK